MRSPSRTFLYNGTQVRLFHASGMDALTKAQSTGSEGKALARHFVMKFVASIGLSALWKRVLLVCFCPYIKFRCASIDTSLPEDPESMLTGQDGAEKGAHRFQGSLAKEAGYAGSHHE